MRIYHEGRSTCQNESNSPKMDRFKMLDWCKCREFYIRRFGPQQQYAARFTTLKVYMQETHNPSFVWITSNMIKKAIVRDEYIHTINFLSFTRTNLLFVGGKMAHITGTIQNTSFAYLFNIAYFIRRDVQAMCIYPYMCEGNLCV